MPLYLVGGGLGPGYQTGILDDILSKSEKVYVESYTVPGVDWLASYVKGRASGEVVVAARSMLEEGAARIVEEARDRIVAVVVPGDPLIATTHKAIIMAAARAGVSYRVVPGVSGVCASKTLAMLDYYKYGRTVTVPGPWRQVKAFSILGYIYDNACIGLHTHVLLDIDPDGRQLPPSEAARILVGLEEEAGVNLLSHSSVMVVEKAGYEDGRVKIYESLQGLAAEDDDWLEPSSLIIPGEVSAVEAEAVEAVYGWSGLQGIRRSDACRARILLDESLGL